MKILLKFEHVLHVVETSGFVLEPECCAHGTCSEGHAGRSFVSEFHPLAIGREHDRVITDYIATTQSVHADFTRFARTNVSEATMGDIVLVRSSGLFV
jgi:hypothetical protein